MLNNLFEGGSFSKDSKEKERKMKEEKFELFFVSEGQENKG